MTEGEKNKEILEKADWLRDAFVKGKLLREAEDWLPIATSASDLWILRLLEREKRRRPGWEPVVWVYLQKDGAVGVKVGRLHADGWWQAGWEWHSTGLIVPGSKWAGRSSVVKGWAEQVELELKALIRATDRLKE